MKKVSLFLIFFAVLLLTSGMVNVNAADEWELSFDLNYDETAYTVSGYTKIGEEELIIPSTYDDIPVTSIGSDAFSNCTSLTNIIIPDSITTIDGSAFSNCTSLTNIIIPDNVTTIEYSTFSNCTSLTNITIPDSVTSIGNSAFSNCTSLTNITIPDNVTSIGNSVFSNCTNLTNITIPDSITNIGESVFADCTSLTNIIIPDRVKTIGYNAFSNCTSLANITIPDSVTTIGYNAFSNCTNLTNITIPDSVTSIGSNAFNNCTNLTKITIPDSVVSIGEYAFYKKNVIWCTTNSYAKTWAIENEHPYVLTDGNDDANVINGTIGTRFTWILDKETGFLEIKGTGDMPSFANSKNPPWDDYRYNIFSIKISEGITSIGEYNFYNLINLKSIEFSDDVKTIEDNAFDSCYDLENIIWGKGIEEIGYYAFGDCTSIAELIIPETVNTIESYAFRYCTSLKNIKIPYTLNYLGDAFSLCSSLSNVEFELDENYDFGLESILSGTFNGCSIKEIIVPSTIKRIGYSAFDSSLEKITIYNPECEFSSDCGISYNTTIYGFKGSTAEAFADEVCAKFVDIETVHTHSYKTIETVGYCSFSKCICGKIEGVEHTDSDYNAICDNCEKSTNFIELDVPLEQIKGDKYLAFTAVKEGKYTLTPSENFEGELRVYNEEKIFLDSTYSKPLSYNLEAGEKVFWYIYLNEFNDFELTLTYSEIHTHSYNSEITKEPTCTTNGVRTYTCSCGHSYTETIWSTDHSYNSEITKEPTCTTNGVRTYTCSCGDSYTETIWSTDHSYDSWYILRRGTCTEPTVIKRDCTNCDYSYTMYLNTKGQHETKETVIKATDTDDGKIITSCSNCGTEIDSITIPQIASVELSVTKYTNNGKVRTPSVTVKDSTGKILKKDTDYTVTYSSGRKDIGKYTVTVKFKGNYSGKERLTFAIVPATSTKLAYSAKSTTSVKLSWKAVSGATGYKIYKYNTSTKKYETVAVVVGKTSYTISSLKAGTSYKFKVKAYKELSDESFVWGNASKEIITTTKPATPTLKVTAGTKKATLSWNKATGTGYEIVYSTSSKFSSYKKVTISTSSTVKTTVKSLSKGKKYYFKIRAYKTIDGKKVYGSYSSVKSVKIK